LIGWLLDTNVVEEISRAAGSETVKAWAKAQPEEAVFLSILTFGEYEKGIHKLADDDPRRGRFSQARDALLRRWRGRVLPVSDAAVLRWGAISGKVRRDTGHPPPVIDTLLAATALEHNLYLATRNTEDVRLSGAAVFNPWKDDPADFPLA
jgi:predicted nucleic acid-binding protein